MLIELTEEGQKKKELESIFFLSAVDTGRVSSVNFVLNHCVNFSKWTLDKKADLGKVAWKKLAASSWASDVLSALLSTSLAEGMMLAVIEEACYECVGLLQSWSTKNPPKSASWIGWSEPSCLSDSRLVEGMAVHLSWKCWRNGSSFRSCSLE